MTIEEFKPGQRVRVLQTIERRDGDWQTALEGVVEKVDVAPTGSWYAHGKDDRFWLRRILIRKDDGEQTLVAVDQWTRVEPA